MKILKQVLFFLLVVLSTGMIYSQIRLEPVFTDISFSHTNSYSSKWEVRENNGGSLVNSAVATLRKQGSAANQSLNFDERYASFGSAIIRFKTCQAVGKTFSVFWTTYNWGGARQNLSSFQVTVLPPPMGQITPTFAFSSINGACNQVTLCVTNSLPGATYAWNNGLNNGFMTSGTCANYNAPPPALVTIAAACGTGPNSASSTSQAPPLNFTAGVSINQGGSLTICQFESVLLDATSNTCINNPNNWVWSSTGGTIFNKAVISGSTADASFTADNPGTYTVTIQTTDFLGNPATANVNINVLSQSDPQCNIFFLKKSADNPKVLAANSKKMGNRDVNTGGSDEGFKIDVNDKSTTKKGIYPNPANEVLNIGDIQGVQIIEIIDLNGKIIRTVSVGKYEVNRVINVSDLSGGIYILKKTKQSGQVEAAKFQVIH